MSSAIVTSEPTARLAARIPSRAALALVAFCVAALAVAVAVLAPVAPTPAGTSQLNTASAAEQFVADAHIKACPGPVPTVTCSAAASGWTCRWTGGVTEIARTSQPNAAMAC